MIDRKKVIKGLDHCPRIPFGLCFSECQNYDCKYYDDFGIEKLHHDAIALLKEQETRVISLDEAVDGNHCYYLEFRYHLDCGWVKCDFDRMYLDGEVAMLFSREKTFYQQAEHYGILWRLWNKRPTYDQRKEMKWGD